MGGKWIVPEPYPNNQDEPRKRGPRGPRWTVLGQETLEKLVRERVY